MADRETGRAVETDTPFQAASLSKPVTAAAVMHAVEQGLLTLDTPINDLLGRYRLPDNEWTLRRTVTPGGC